MDDNIIGFCALCGEALYVDDEFHVDNAGERDELVYCMYCVEEPDAYDDFPMYLEYDDWKYDHIDTGDDW